MNIVAEVKKELEELKKIGSRIPARAIAYPEANADKINEYYDNGMSISEIADLVLVIV